MSLTVTARKLVKASQAKGGSLPRDLTEAQFLEMIEFEPRGIQSESLQSAARFNAEVWHRRAGKSVKEVVRLLTRAVACPFDHGRYAYTAPTQDQVKDIVWHYMVHYGQKVPGFKERESSKEIWVPQIRGGISRIKLYGVDNPKQRLRGLYLDGGAADEYQDTPQHVWTEQIRPMLADENRKGVDLWGYPNQSMTFIGTPKGRNQLYRIYRDADLWQRGLAVIQQDLDTGKDVPVFRNDWAARLYRASETGILAKRELQDALSDMGRSKYLQEFECSWDAIVEGAIFGPEMEGLREQGRITNVPVNPNVPVNTAWDLGWDDFTAIWFFQQIGDEVFVIDFYQISHQDLPGIAEDLRKKRYKYGYHLLPHDVEVTEGLSAGGKSRRSILNECGVRVTTVPRVKRKEDAHAAAQALLPRCYFSEARTMDGVDALCLYRREKDPRLDVLRPTPVHDWTSHAADAMMTLAMGIRKMGGYGSMNHPVAET